MKRERLMYLRSCQASGRPVRCILRISQLQVYSKALVSVAKVRHHHMWVRSRNLQKMCTVDWETKETTYVEGKESSRLRSYAAGGLPKVRLRCRCSSLLCVQWHPILLSHEALLPASTKTSLRKRVNCSMMSYSEVVLYAH